MNDATLARRGRQWKVVQLVGAKLGGADSANTQQCKTATGELLFVTPPSSVSVRNRM